MAHYHEWWDSTTEFHIQRHEDRDNAKARVIHQSPPECGWHTVATYSTDDYPHSRPYDKVKKQALNHMWDMRRHYIKMGAKNLTWRVISVRLSCDLVR